MIKLLVEDYCHECPEFYPEKIGGEVLYANGDVVTVGTTFVVCDDREKCQRIKKHLEEQK